MSVQPLSTASSYDDLPPPVSSSTFEASSVNEWMCCFCVVKFDIEIGQTLEHTFPPTKFTDEEITNLCFLSFPDSNTGINGDTIYSFRTRLTCAEGETPKFLHGYVFFRQEKDPSLARGYLQKSVVLLSVHPYVGLFKKMMSVVGPLYFDIGGTLLESAHHDTSCWPAPKPGTTFELPILGSTLTFHAPFASIPHIIDPSSRSIAVTPRDQVVSNLQSVNIYSIYKPVISKLWLLWELVLTGEPILVVSPTPPQCSDAVLGLISLISPLRYCGDHRPYFTIHDADFKDYTGALPDNKNGLILGVTNPFFLKALNHWPHIVSIGTLPQSKVKTTEKKTGLAAALQFGSRDRVSKHVTEYRQSITTSSSGLVEPDSRTTKQLKASSNQPPNLLNAVNNEILRRHFLRLTESFLVPLERYFASLMPLQRSISIFHRPPRLKPFNKNEFLEILDGIEKRYVVDSKSKEIELYKRFLASANFQGWYADRKQAALQQLNKLYRNALIEADLPSVAKGGSLVELVDLFLRLRDQVILEEALPPTDETKSTIAKLNKQIADLKPFLPADGADKTQQRSFANVRPTRKLLACTTCAYLTLCL